jgi:glucuronate isomerase
MSYPRHEYFRRTLCNLMGRDIEDGLVPNDEKIVGPMIRNICYSNARNYMAFPGVTDAAPAQKAKKKK